MSVPVGGATGPASLLSADDPWAPVVPPTVVPKKITGIEFGMLSGLDMRQLSHIPIVNRELYYTNARKPIPFGVLDPRLGTSDKKGTCSTCGQKLADCVGHFGFIKLELPVFHIGYFKSIIEVLQRICKTCARILLPEEKCHDYLAKMRNPNLETLARKNVAKKILTECKKTVWCPHCGSANGSVHKVGALKLVHERYKVKNNDDETREFQDSFQEALTYNKDLASFLPRAQEDLTPLRVRELFKRIPDDDVELLDMDPENTRPELMVLTHFLVPPVCIRPSIPSDAASGSNEDDLTMKLTEIILINGILKSNLSDKGAPMQTIMENWEHLQMQCAMFINSELPGFPASLRNPGKPQRSLAQRLKGKQGRFRGNLSGKRVDFSGRTVISPDPNLKINQVAVPELVCKVLTYPEKVTDYNIEHLRRCVINGPDKHPGANYVESANGNKRYLKFGNREEISRQLKVGDIVERHLMDDDVVLFNRQPSLHKLSIMCHRVKVLPWRTFRFNECVCTPYNADFDGDEMNLHVPQTEEARAEALTLMSVTRNLVTPRNGQPIISATQDFITASYLLSRKNMFFDRAQFCQLCSYLDVEDRKIDLPPPVILKPVELWTGKQIFRMLIKPNEKTNVLLNFETTSRSYSSKVLHMDPADGYVCFLNSELISGTLDKKIVGEGSKDSLFYALITTYSPEYAAECMSRLAKLTSRWLMNYGFTIGISDVTPSEKLNTEKEVIVSDGYKKCNENIQLFNDQKLEPQPGCTPDQTLEAVLNRDLSNIRETCGKLCLAELHWRNSALTMAVCGSKGSNINISQMIACVGQQTVSGSRIPNGFMNRSLPHFKKFSRDPEAKGFVKNSFFTGLNATEFFFHTMGGREGLVDTAVKTAETGYMQRRLMKALEDLSVQYDNTVRNSAGGIVQFNYGDDGLDPTAMEAPEGRPSNMVRTMQWIRNTMPCRDEPPLLPWQMCDIVSEWMDAGKHRELISDKFAGELIDFIAECAKASAKMREQLGISPELDKPITKEECDSAIEREANIDPSIRTVLVSNQYTRTQIISFLDLCIQKYHRATTEPGTAVGALGAQSIGEPGTQMTLKTFHFAGVASMNITLGVPRIKEIINASKKISTPIITAELVSNKNERAARIVKGRIEKTTLKEISVYIKSVFAPGQCYLSIKLNLEAIESLQLDVDVDSIKQSIMAAGIKGLKEKHVRICSAYKLHIYPPDTQREAMLHVLQTLLGQVGSVIVKGLPSVSRAVINRKNDGTLNLLVEGLNLRDVMGTPGVVGTKTKSNHIIEVEATLGIEAARQTIMDEIQYTMKSHSMNIDSRHVMLLADLMTFKGEILGITRFGIAKMKDSVLMLASFEKTTDHLFDAAVHSRKDDIVGVSECIIMGIPIPIGTGLFKLLRQVHTPVGTPSTATTPQKTVSTQLHARRRDPIFSSKVLISYV